MSMENNDKYIAKSWIDNGEEEGFKKSFLESLLNQWQGEGNGFDADTLDGKHYCQIINEIDGKVYGLLPSFQIGNVHVNRDNIDANNGILKIGFDGVQLNVPGEDGYENYQNLPWDTQGSVRNPVPNLLEVFKDLYDIVKVKAEQSDFDDYKSTVDDINDFKDALENSISYDTNGKVLINAQSINGFRIYIKTRDQYAAMKATAAADETSDAYKLINDQHNLFILTDAEEIDDTLLAQQPGTQPISSYYEFQISDPRSEEDENGVIVTKYYLQYKHSDGETWHDICETSEFIDPNLLTQKIIDTLNSTTNYTLNKEVFIKTLKEIEFNDGEMSNLSEYIRQSGIRGLKSGTRPNLTFPDNNTVPRYVDMDNLIETIKNEVKDEINQTWLDKVYPVGCVFMTFKSDYPKAILGGGEWTKIEGRFLIGAGSFTEDQSTTEYIRGTTGGRRDVSLGISQIPSHRHSHDHLHQAPGQKYLLSNNNIAVNPTEREWPAKKSGTNLHMVYGVNGGDGNGISESPATGVVRPNWSADGTVLYSDQNTAYTGGGGKHTNIPPYIAVNMWRRTG